MKKLICSQFEGFVGLCKQGYFRAVKASPLSFN